MLAHDEDDLGADSLSLGDPRAGLDAEGFGLVAGRDAAGGVGEGGDDGDGAAAILGVELLLDRGEEAVEIDVEAGEAVGLESFWHKPPSPSIVFVFYLL